MEEKRAYTEIHTNIIKHLFVLAPCPKCQERHPLSLDTVYRGEWVHCPDCRSRQKYSIGPHNRFLIEFVKSFDNLHAQLRAIGLPLAFFPDLTETIWSRDDKSQDNT
jgi:hypothetical protein